MPISILNNEIYFPNPDLAEEDGLLAIGGDLSEERLILAYKNGIFPWYNEKPILWWCPNPRCVLYPDDLKISKSMEQVIKKNLFKFTFNEAFEQVILYCKKIERKDQDGTWIDNEIMAAYVALHKKGIAISAEAWQSDELVGGLYGIKLGSIFFGESMFSKSSNASKFAFIQLVKKLKSKITLIDCQIHTPHLESLGATMIDRTTFLEIIKKGVSNV